MNQKVHLLNFYNSSNANLLLTIVDIELLQDEIKTIYIKLSCNFNIYQKILTENLFNLKSESIITDKNIKFNPAFDHKQGQIVSN